MAMPLPMSEQTRWFLEEVQPHEGALRAYLRGNFPDVKDVDDLIQESYLRLLNAHKTGTITNPRAYLFTTARNAALSLLRRPKIFSDVPVTDLTAPGVLESDHDTAAMVSTRQEIDLLASAIDTLPPRCREIFILRKLQNIPQKEIAARLGLSEQTVQVQITRGVSKCAAYFRERGITRA